MGNMSNKNVGNKKKKVRERLSRFRILFFREKYRFDQGNAFLVFVNFGLLVASLVRQGGGDSSDIKKYVILGLFSTWFLGYFLDRVIKVQDAQERISLKRSPIWRENFEHHDELGSKMDMLIKKIEVLEKKLEKVQ